MVVAVEDAEVVLLGRLDRAGRELTMIPVGVLCCISEEDVAVELIMLIGMGTAIPPAMVTPETIEQSVNT